nr:MAG TPA: hypothetical protein [Caudoviricetes sp.]
MKGLSCSCSCNPIVELTIYSHWYDCVGKVLAQKEARRPAMSN